MPEDTQTTSKKQSAVWEIPATWENVRGGISNTSDGVLAWGRAPEADVSANRARLAKRLGVPPGSIVTLEQVHGSRVVSVTKSEGGAGFLDPLTRIPSADGLFTSEQDLVLMTSHADCAPIFFNLPSKRAIGLVHSGWRGTLAGIGSQAVLGMCEKYDASPGEIEVAIGPQIATRSYEVGADVARDFIREFGQTVVAYVNGKSYLDVFAALIVDLLRAGVVSARYCPRPPNTFSEPRWSFYRRDGEQSSGMLAYFTML